MTNIMFCLNYYPLLADKLNDMKDLGITKGNFTTGTGGRVLKNGKLFTSVWSGYVSEDIEQLENGESWLKMRRRTDPIRLKFEQIRKADTELVSNCFNTAQKCGLLPSELLKQRGELLSALETMYNFTSTFHHPQQDSFRGMAKIAIEKATE